MTGNKIKIWKMLHFSAIWKQNFFLTSQDHKSKKEATHFYSFPNEATGPYCHEKEVGLSQNPFLCYRNVYRKCGGHFSQGRWSLEGKVSSSQKGPLKAIRISSLHKDTVSQNRDNLLQIQIFSVHILINVVKLGKLAILLIYCTRTGFYSTVLGAFVHQNYRKIN